MKILALLNFEFLSILLSLQINLNKNPFQAISRHLLRAACVLEDTSTFSYLNEISTLIHFVVARTQMIQNSISFFENVMAKKGLAKIPASQSASSQIYV